MNQMAIRIDPLDCQVWGKYGAMVEIPVEDEYSNNAEYPNRATIELYENGVALPFINSNPWKVSRYEQGRYTLYEGKLYFSSSDRTDPRENGRTYTLHISEPKTLPEVGKIYPNDVGIEITNICNARCCYCPLYQNNGNALKYPRRAMEARLFEKIIDEIAQWPTGTSIYLNNGGEPLLCRDFVRRIDYCRQRGVSERIILQTNAEFLDEDKARVLLDAGVGYIVPAFSGATKSVYESHHIGCHYERVLENIRRFARIRNEGDYGTTIQVKFMRTRQNEHEIEKAYHMFGEFLSPELDRFQEEYAHTWNDPYLKKAGIALTDINSRCIVRPCRMAYTYMAIYANGDVGACSLDYNDAVLGHALGNVSESSLQSIYNGKYFARLRKAMEGLENIKFSKNKLIARACGLPEKCRDCYLMYYREGDIDNLLPESRLYCKAAFSSYIYKFGDAL